MSTRSRIGIEGEDGRIVSVYCHFDGDLSGVGATLLAHHNSAEAAVALTALGDLSCCDGGSVVAPAGSRDGDVVSYRLWRGQDDTDAHMSAGRAAYLAATAGSAGEYAYLYGPRGWEYHPLDGGPFRPLTAAAIAAEE